MNKKNYQDKNSIPATFLSYRQFILVKTLPKPGGGTEKVPCNVRGIKINAHDPASWLTADDALTLANQNGLHVGFVFTGADPFFFIDLDYAWDGARWSDMANDIFARFPGAAVEVSNSGTGCHIFGAGSSPPHKSVVTSSHGKLEFYTEGRFVLIPPGEVWGDARLDFTAALGAFVSAYGLTPDPLPDVAFDHDGPQGDATSAQYSDDELLAIFARIRGGAVRFGDKISGWQLFTADRAALCATYPEPSRADGAGFDWSQADGALLCHLAFMTGNHRSRMWDLFRRSALYRPEKYEGKGFYRFERLIDHTARAITQYYNIPNQRMLATQASAGVGLAAAALPEPVAAGEFIRTAPPPREWTVKNIIPHRQVTLLAGDGGTGKTTILLQLAFAAASMTSWFGHLVHPRRVLFVSGEDETDELHYRVHEVSQAMGAQSVNNFWLMSFEQLQHSEIMTVMGQFKDMPLITTPLYTHLVQKISELGIDLLILDPTVDLFGGDENNARHVRQFITLLRQEIAIRHNCTVLIASHPSRSSMVTGTGYGGSAHWHNKVRSRLYFKNDEHDDNARILEHMKANRSKRAEAIKVQFKKGIFVLDSAAELSSPQVDETFLTILKRRFKAGFPVSPHHSRSYAPTVFASDENSQGLGKDDFERAMMRLKEAGKIDFIEDGPPSRRRTHIIPVENKAESS